MRRSKSPGKRSLPAIILSAVFATALLIYGGVILWNVMHKNDKGRPIVVTEPGGNGNFRAMLEVPDENIPLSTIDKNCLTKDENGYKIYTENGEKTSLTGIDVSKWNGTIDWKKVRGSGIEFVMIRLGNSKLNSGDITLDPMFKEYMEGAVEAGLKVGVYYYTQAITKEEAVAEAEFCIKNLEDYHVTFPVVFDTERYDGSGRADNLDNALRTEIARSFMDRIKEAGYTPAIYMNTSWSLMNIDLKDLTEYDHWYAYYGDDLYWPYRFTMWQYTEKAQIPGIEGNVDLNISFVDYSK